MSKSAVYDEMSLIILIVLMLNTYHIHVHIHLYTIVSSICFFTDVSKFGEL